MKAKWLKIILGLTHRIYKRKKLMAEERGFRTIKNRVFLFALEVILAFVSIPMYVALRPQQVTAYVAEKGKYEKVVFDFRLRHVLPLAVFGIICLIWVLKMILIIALPRMRDDADLFANGLAAFVILVGAMITFLTIEEL